MPVPQDPNAKTVALRYSENPEEEERNKQRALTDRFFAGLAARLQGATPPVVAMPTPVRMPGSVSDDHGGDANGGYLRLVAAARFACVSIPTLKSWERRGLRILRPSPGVVLVKKSDLIGFIEREP